MCFTHTKNRTVLNSCGPLGRAPFASRLWHLLRRRSPLFSCNLCVLADRMSLAPATRLGLRRSPLVPSPGPPLFPPPSCVWSLRPGFRAFQIALTRFLPASSAAQLCNLPRPALMTVSLPSILCFSLLLLVLLFIFLSRSLAPLPGCPHRPLAILPAFPHALSPLFLLVVFSPLGCLLLLPRRSLFRSSRRPPPRFGGVMVVAFPLCWLPCALPSGALPRPGLPSPFHRLAR